jgi:hypothetical protein
MYFLIGSFDARMSSDIGVMFVFEGLDSKGSLRQTESTPIIVQRIVLDGEVFQEGRGYLVGLIGVSQHLEDRTKAQILPHQVPD